MIMCHEMTLDTGMNMIIIMGRFMFCVMSHSGHVSSHPSLGLTEKHDNIPIFREVSVSDWGPELNRTPVPRSSCSNAGKYLYNHRIFFTHIFL